MFFPPRCKSFCGRCGSRAASEVLTFIPASYQRRQKKKESTSARIKVCCRPAAQHENTTSWSSVGGPAVIVSCQTSKVLPHSFAPDILLPFIYFFPFAGILAAAPLVTKFSSFPPTVVHRAAMMEEAGGEAALSKVQKSGKKDKNKQKKPPTTAKVSK